MAGIQSKALNKSGTGKFPILGVRQLADLLGVSPDLVRQLERQGRFSKISRDRYDSEAAIRGTLAYLRDEERRSSRSAEAKRVLEARAREIEIRTAKEEGRLIDIEVIDAIVADILGTYRSELEGVAAAATRDLTVRASIRSALDSAIGRCRRRFEQRCDDLRAGKPVHLKG